MPRASDVITYLRALHWWRAGCIIGLFSYGVVCARDYEASYFIHGVDLLIHEAGHLVLGIFGQETLTILGGSLLQLLMPVAFVIYFLRQQQRYAAMVGLWWVGQNFHDVAVYVRDARVLQLPLVSVGGDDGEVIHDWNWLLDHWGLLMHEQTVANLFAGIGWLLLIAALLGGLYYSSVSSPDETVTPAAALEPFESETTTFVKPE